MAIYLLEVLDYGRKAAAHYGDIRADLERKGTPIGVNDLQLAAHARSEGLILVTNDPREFEPVAGAARGELATRLRGARGLAARALTVALRGRYRTAKPS